MAATVTWMKGQLLDLQSRQCSKGVLFSKVCWAGFVGVICSHEARTLAVQIQ